MVDKKDTLWSGLQYHTGFGNHFESEAEPGALVKGRNNPQKCPMDLYAEQLSGTPFTYSKAKNQRSWLYRIMPTCNHNQWFPCSDFPKWISNFDGNDESLVVTPAQRRWTPQDILDCDFMASVRTMMGAGGPAMKSGLSIHYFGFRKNMSDKNVAMYSSDGDLLLVPQGGKLYITTEFGRMTACEKEIAVIPRGIKFSVDTDGEGCRGWIAECYEGHFKIPDLGPIGSNGLANERDFETPVAAYSDVEGEQWTIYNRFQGKMFQYTQDHSPYDVVAWHGNYYPFRYDLNKFNTMGTISYDHPDPCIFTVLTVQTNDPGQAALDFVIFPPRWLVGENTFRPPYYHRNTMTEFMGNIAGTYDAKEKGFIPGASSLHSCMSGHGPEAEVFEKASNADLKPQFVGAGSLAFMFETCYMMKLTAHGDTQYVDTDYQSCWKSLPRLFKKTSQ